MAKSSQPRNVGAGERRFCDRGESGRDQPADRRALRLHDAPVIGDDVGVAEARGGRNNDRRAGGEGRKTAAERAPDMKERQCDQGAVGGREVVRQHRGDGGGGHIAVGEFRRLGRASRAAGRQEGDGFLRHATCWRFVPKAEVRRQNFFAEGDAAVERDRDNPLERRNRANKALDLLEQPARGAGRRGEQDLRACGLQLRNDSFAAEQQVERVDGRKAHRRPIGDRHRGAVRDEDRDRILGPDAVGAEPAPRGGEEAEEIPRGRHGGGRIHCGSEIDKRFMVGPGQGSAARDQPEDVRTFVENCSGARLERLTLLRRILDPHSFLPSGRI